MAEQIDAVALVEFVAKSLVDDADSVQVKQVDNPESTVIELHVSPDDMGKVIGKPVSYTHLDVYKRQELHLAKLR